ncbi:MAG: hypothetical protein ACREFO_13685 [Acetobacteraceae bacterium]
MRQGRRRARQADLAKDLQRLRHRRSDKVRASHQYRFEADDARLTLLVDHGLLPANWAGGDRRYRRRPLLSPDGCDESGTLAALKAILEEVRDPAFTNRHYRIVVL